MLKIGGNHRRVDGYHHDQADLAERSQLGGQAGFDASLGPMIQGHACQRRQHHHPDQPLHHTPDVYGYIGSHQETQRKRYDEGSQEGIQQDNG
ncbi:hypothetical protein D3C76_1203860 [compost metagenome]